MLKPLGSKMAPFTWGEIEPEYRSNMKKHHKEWDEYKDTQINPQLVNIEADKERRFRKLMRAEIYHRETSEGRKITKLEEVDIVDRVASKMHYRSKDATQRRKQ